MTERSGSFRIRVRGAVACFTRPEMKVERVSYEVMTPSAARGLLECIFWKPGLVWKIDKIEVLKPVRWMSFRRNEVSSITKGTEGIFIEDDRTQRNMVGLRDVDYVVETHFEMTEKAGPRDNVNKFTDQFWRRVERGEHYKQPCLGFRECPADVFTADDAGKPIGLTEGGTRPLGPMFWDFDWWCQRPKEHPPTPLFFQAELKDGVLLVPSIQQARTYTLEGGKK